MVYRIKTLKVKYLKRLLESGDVALIGFMASGKTTLLKRFSRDFACFDLDAEIEKKFKKKVNRIFSEKKEFRFRRIEFQILKHVLALQKTQRSKPLLLSCGGGLVTFQPSCALLKKRFKVVWLNVSFETVWKRLRLTNRESRPLLWDSKKNAPKKKSEVKRLFLERQKTYALAADFQLFRT